MNESFRTMLEDRLQLLTGRVGRIEGHLRHTDEPVNPDFADRATEGENDEVLQALDDEGRRELFEIRSALARIDAGTYGICEVTGERIPEARLRLIPYARTVVGATE
jgi:DnaK suppressor protein